MSKTLDQVDHYQREYLQHLMNDPVFFASEIWRDRELYKKAPFERVEIDIIRFAANPTGALPGNRGILAPRGMGKALALDTIIPTPTGWRTMGEIQTGDLVLDEGHKECRVTFATEVMVGHPCYEVAFSNGDKIIADAEHQWLVERGLRDPEVLTTEKIRSQCGDGFRHMITSSKAIFYINTVEPVDSVPVRCIQVDSPSHLYLAGRSMVPTHNTHLVPAILSCYRLLRDPDRKILIPSRGSQHAVNVVGLIREWINCVPFLTTLKPRDSQKDTMTAFQVGPAKESVQKSVTAVGIDGQLEGMRAHSIFPDDVETDTNTLSREARDKLASRCNEFVFQLYPTILEEQYQPVDPVEIVFVGTPHHEESVYQSLGEKSFFFQTWPISYPLKDSKLINLAPIFVEDLEEGRAQYTPDKDSFDLNPTMPYKFDSAEIRRRMATGDVAFRMQNMLECDLAETTRFPLRVSDAIIYDVLRDLAPASISYGTRDNYGSTEVEDIPVWPKVFLGNKFYRPFRVDPTSIAYRGTKGYIDPAGRGDDRTGVAAVGQLNGYFWVKGVVGLPGGVDGERLDEVCVFLRDHMVTEAYVEDNIDVFDSYFNELQMRIKKHALQPGVDARFPDGWRCSLAKNRSVMVQKERRIIAAIEPLLSTHRVIFDKKCFFKVEGERDIDSLYYQISHMNRDRKALAEDGKIDALANCLAMWVPSTMFDHAKATSMSKGQELKDTMKLMDKYRGIPAKRGPSYLTTHIGGESLGRGR